MAGMAVIQNVLPGGWVDHTQYPTGAPGVGVSATRNPHSVSLHTPGGTHTWRARHGVSNSLLNFMTLGNPGVGLPSREFDLASDIEDVLNSIPAGGMKKKQKKKKSAWNNHVSKVVKKNPHLSFKQAVQLASSQYTSKR